MLIWGEGGVDTGARKLNNQQSTPPGCFLSFFLSSAVSLVWFPSVIADADSGSPTPATLALTQLWARGNPPTPAPLEAWWKITYTVG